MLLSSASNCDMLYIILYLNRKMQKILGYFTVGKKLQKVYIIVNYKYKLTLSTHGRRGFLTSPMQSVQVISKSTITML